MKHQGLKGRRNIGDKMSEIEDIVIKKIEARAETGERKYNTTMERSDLTRKAWLIHAQEEALDLAIYLQKLIMLEEE
jgi:hypothetical protein